MLSVKMETLLCVAEHKNFTRAAEELSLTQPAVSHHIKELEQELGVPLFIRGKGGLKLTDQGEIAVRYARRIKALDGKLRSELANFEKNVTNLKLGLTHTAESNLTTEALAKCAAQNPGLSITIATDTIKNLYDMLGNYELDLAIVEGIPVGSGFSSLMLDTDYLVCAMSVNNPLSRRAMVTLNELKGDGRIHTAQERLYGRTAQGQDSGAAHRKPEHGTGDPHSVQPGLRPPGDTSGNNQDLSGSGKDVQISGRQSQKGPAKRGAFLYAVT